MLSALVSSNPVISQTHSLIMDTSHVPTAKMRNTLKTDLAEKTKERGGDV